MKSASQTTHLLLVVAAFLLAIKVWPKIKAFVTLWRKRYTLDTYSIATEPAAAPVQLLLEAGAAEVRALGFEHGFSFDIDSDDALIRIDCHLKLDEPGTSVLVKSPLLPHTRPFDVHFQTRFRSSSGEEILVETVGGGAILLDRSELHHVAYHGALPTDQLWQKHQERVADYETTGHSRILQHFGHESIDQRRKDQEAEFLEGVEQGDYIRYPDGSYRYSAAAASAALKIIQKTSVAPSTGGGSLESATPYEPEAMRIEAARCSLSREANDHKDQPGYLILLALSFVAFFVGIWIWLGIEPAVSLSVIILVHELGHFLGMKICGYSNARILFVPMFGGVAIGKKNDATPTQELIVLLLGPMPGIAIGFGAILASVAYSPGYDWLYDFGVLSVIINYLNLLPVMPLDGGRILNALFMRRVPRLQFIFSIISIAALGFAAFGLGSVLLGVLAGLGLLRVKSQWLAGTISKKVFNRPDHAQADLDEATLMVVQETRATIPPDKLPPLQYRFAIVNPIVTALGQVKATIPVMIFGAFIYLSCLLLPIITTIIWRSLYR